jgi:hypothetical protein
MAFVEHFAGLLPARTGRDTAAWFPHVLAIAVNGSAQENLAGENIRQAAEACASAFSDSFETIELLWGNFFEGWAIDSISSKDAAGLISADEKYILEGRYVARIVMPAALFLASPNPSGLTGTNESGSGFPLSRQHASLGECEME